MPILKISDETLGLAAEVISGGGLVAFPTETVYGLGGDAFNPAALARIFEAKGRPRFDPLIVHIAAVEALEAVADPGLLDAAARGRLAALAEHFWPGPLSLILPKRKAVPDLATSGLPTVAVRLPAHDAARRLIQLSTGAVAAPSANPFGYLSPTRAEHVMEMLGEKAGLILDGGPSQVGLESTVLDVCHDPPRLLRPGGTPREAIESLIGPVASGPADSGEGMASPGLLKSHYAPRVPLAAHGIETLCQEPGLAGDAFLFFDGASRDAWLSAQGQNKRAAAIEVLSETGSLLEAAAGLFGALHKLDRGGVKRIRAQLAPEEGLGAAINDRLRRAAAE
jgi:L-threonylcarbamoyladenylate synthase